MTKLHSQYGTPATPSTPSPVPGNANDFIEQQLDARILEIQTAFGSDAVSLNGPLVSGVDDLLRNAIEKIYRQRQDIPQKDRKLVVILTTYGGYIEVVQRIVDTFRAHYPVVEFVVPNYAYSAGTVLVMSGDAIHMDYYARLGPIDPQVETQQARMVPALGYLEQYSRLIKKAEDGVITPAEIQLLINGFDQAELYQYEHQRELSITLLKEWLTKYKFKGWSTTRTRKKRVTTQMKKSRAAQIAKKLNDTKKWHSHGYGISKDVLERDLNLIIDDFGKNPDLCGKIRAYHDLSSDYMVKRGAKGVIHIADEYRPFM